MDEDAILEKTVLFVKETLAHAEKGHDWWHIQRVWDVAKTIAASEKVDYFVVSLGALLHDIADSKFYDGDEEKGPLLATNHLLSLDVSQEVIDQVVFIIKHVSFKGRNELPESIPIALQVVMDADRLDALGAIGIARAFTFGGFKNSVLYDPALPPQMSMDKETYKKHEGTTINHFYEKLFLLKDLMHTTTGRAMAQSRHEYMVAFVDRFKKEWEGSL